MADNVIREVTTTALPSGLLTPTLPAIALSSALSRTTAMLFFTRAQQSGLVTLGTRFNRGAGAGTQRLKSKTYVAWGNEAETETVKV
jgi:hypothetical protein